MKAALNMARTLDLAACITARLTARIAGPHLHRPHQGISGEGYVHIIRMIRSLRLAVVVAVLLFVCVTAFGATPPAPAPTPAQQATEAIGAAEIVMRADSDERFIQGVMALAREPDPAGNLAASLDVLATRIRELSARYNRKELQSSSATRLKSLDRYWKFYAERLSAWRHELQQVTARYSDAAGELVRRRVVWEATRSAAGRRGLTPALSNRVNAVLAQIALAGQALSGPLSRQLELARRGSSVQEEVDSSRKAVEKAFTNLGRRLLRIDALPLLQALGDKAPTEQVLSTLTEGLTIEKEFLEEYHAAHAWRHRSLAMAALVLLPMLLWVGRRTRKLMPGDPDGQWPAHVLLRPISSWLVILLVGVLYFEPGAPMILQSSALLLLLIPVLRLLPRRAYAVLGSWPYIAAGLYLLYQPSFLLVGASLVGRLHLLITGVLTSVALLGVLMRLRRQARTPVAARHSFLLSAVAWLFVAALLVGLIANMVGNVTLSEAMTGGVVNSTYMGLALYAASEVLRAILNLLLTSPTVSRFRSLTERTERLPHSLGRLLNIGALATWVVVTFNVFRVYQPVATWVDGVLKQSLKLGQVSITLGGVLMFVVCVSVSFWLAKTLRFLLQEEVLSRMRLPRGAANSISTLTYYAVVTVGLMVALLAVGFQVGQLAIVLGALGVGIGFGLQNVVNNLVSGLILMFERPIQPGDVVDISGTSGTIREIGLRATKFKTFDGADVVVPNGTLLSEKLTNWTLSDMNRRFNVNVGVAYGSDLKRVLEILANTAKTTPGVIASPEPEVLFIGFGTSSLDFRIRAWSNDSENWMAIQSDLTVRVHDALKAGGVEIPFPQQDLHLRSISPEARAELTGTGPRPAG